MQVTICNDALKEGLLNTASIQAGVPVVHRSEGPSAIRKLPPASADAVVLLGCMQQLSDWQGSLTAIAKVLKPGGRCV